MTSRQPGAMPETTGPPGATAHYWVRLLPLALLIVLGLAGLRGAVGTPRWDGPLHRDGLAVGLALEAVFVVLLELTRRRWRSAHQELVARKLRVTLLSVLGAGMAAVAVTMLLGLNLHLFTGHPGPPRPRPAPAGRPTVKPPRPHQAPGPLFHIPVAALLYTLLVLVLLAGIAVSVWWARRLRPSLGAREDALIVEDSEDLREAVESGRSALRRVDDARAAIIACYLAMEQSLAERGTARSLADTPDELLARARARGVVRGTAASRLTALFYEARFSSHPLGTAQRDAAERALDELAAALAQPEAAQPEQAGTSS
jgi:hypothetical protein